MQLASAASGLARMAPQAYSFLKQHWKAPEVLQTANACLERAADLVQECEWGGLIRSHKGLLQPLCVSMEQLTEYLVDAKIHHENQDLASWFGTADLQAKIEEVEKQVMTLQGNKHYVSIKGPDLGDRVQITSHTNRHCGRVGHLVQICQGDVGDDIPCKVQFDDKKEIDEDWFAVSDLQVLKESLQGGQAILSPGSRSTSFSKDLEFHVWLQELADVKTLKVVSSRLKELENETNERESELKATCLELERQNEALRTLEADIEVAQKNRDQMHIRKQALRREVLEAVMQKEDTELELAKKSEQVKIEEKKLLFAQERCRRAQERMKQAEVKLSKAEQSFEEVQSKRIDEASQEFEDLKEQVASLQEERDRLQKGVLQAQKERDEAENELMEATRHRDQIYQALEKAAEQLRILESSANAASKRNDEVSSLLDQATKNLQQREGEYALLQQKMDAEGAAYRDEYLRLESEIEKLKEDEEKARKDYDLAKKHAAEAVRQKHADEQAAAAARTRRVTAEQEAAEAANSARKMREMEQFESKKAQQAKMSADTANKTAEEAKSEQQKHEQAAEYAKRQKEKADHEAARAFVHASKMREMEMTAEKRAREANLEAKAAEKRAEDAQWSKQFKDLLGDFVRNVSFYFGPVNVHQQDTVGCDSPKKVKMYKRIKQTTQAFMKTKKAEN